MLYSTNHRNSFNVFVIFCMMIFAFFVQTLHCYALQDLIQNPQDTKLEEASGISVRTNHRISDWLKETAATLNTISQLIDSEANMQTRLNKRAGFDLGLSRGYSGAKQAKHLLELASAQTGYGPGKR